MANWGIFGPSNYAGVDQGVDFRGAGPIPALDQATVTDVTSSSIVEGGTYPVVVYRLNTGPYKGQYVYTAENFTPTVHKGQQLRQGQSIGLAKGSYPYIEIGFNKTPTGWNAVAPLGGTTAAGQAMKSYIYGLIGTAAPVTVPNASAAGSSSSSSSGGGGGGILGAAEGTVHFLGEISSAAFWLRALEIVGGFLILLLGLYLLARNVGLASGETNLPGPLSDAALAELQFSPGRRAHTGPRTRRRTVEAPSDAADRRAAIRSRAERAQPSDDIPF